MSRARALLVLLGLLLLPSCVAVGPRKTETDIPSRDPSILIGAFNFSESRVLAEVYGQALEARGFDVDVLSDVGPREIIEPALEQEQIDVAVEYLGAALAFLDPEAVEGATSLEETTERLSSEFSSKGVQVLTPSPGENRNEIVVTQETSDSLGLTAISDLQKVDSDLTFGGPPECPARPLCLEGLQGTYQLEFRAFVPLDTGGPQTVSALEAGQIDAGLLFTTNPAIADGRLVALEDDRDLQPPENIVPVVRREIVEEQGPAFVAVIESISAKLTNNELRALNEAVDIRHHAPEDAAADWLDEQGFE